MNGNMFDGMVRPGMLSTEGIGDVGGRLVLVEVLAALTNYTHAPFVRQPQPYLPSNLMDDLVLENRRGGVSQQMVAGYAAHMGSLNNMPGEQSRIAGSGGYQENNKGLMKMKFRIQNGGINEEFISVLGYVTGNDLYGELSENATFVPTFSWKHSAMMGGNVGLDNLSMVVERVGRRTDYLLNDGSHAQSKGLVSMRPTDIMSAAGDVIAQNDVIKQAEMEGIQMSNAAPIYGSGSINHVGVILSNRRNFNPTKYSNQLLSGALKASNKVAFGDDDGARRTSDFASELNTISTISNDMLDSENRPSQDEFLSAMKDIGTLRNLRGWRVGDLAHIFPTFEDSIPPNGFPMMDTNQYEVIDYTEISQVFGTSSTVETIAQELIFNILDLMAGNGISRIDIKGSNCDEMAGEDRLSNIVMFPSGTVSLSNNDLDTAAKGIYICDELRHQIFNKLNGTTVNGLTPLRFRMCSELMGNTEIWLTNPNSESEGNEVYWCFPTFAPNPYSPVFGDNDTIAQLSDSVYSNIRSYILDK